MSSLKTYSELVTLESFEDRFRYLALRGVVGDQTFGADRWMNQRFYTSKQWRDLRHYVIARDMACDLATPEYDVNHRLIIHHMNPMRVQDILHDNEDILDPEFLITTTHKTHNAIHYGDERQLARPFVARSPGDTKLW
jgi:hypothetical protein